MSDIFISYASADRQQAETLAKGLKAQGWTVWWDRTIPAGKTFDEVIEEALAAAKSVIVLWSEKSVTSNWVRTEAQEGADRNILIPVLIEKVQIPLAFRRIQAADLIGWDGSYTASSFQELVGDIAALLGPSPKTEEERQKAEAEAQRRAEEERQQAEAEAKRKAEEKRKQDEAEAKGRAEEKRKQDEAEAKRKDVGASEQIEVIPTSEVAAIQAPVVQDSIAPLEAKPTEPLVHEKQGAQEVEEPIPDGLDHTKPTGLETKKAWSKSQKTKVLATICIVTLIAIISIGIFFKGPTAPTDSIDDVPDTEKTWVTCLNKACNAQYEMSLKEYYKFVTANASPMVPAPALTCEKCQKPSVYKAEKCQNAACGIVFRSGSVPNDFPDRCPKCKQSATEELRKARKRI